MSNFMMLLMEAVSKDQILLSQQQIIDAKTTQMSVGFEEAVYSYWNSQGGPLAQAAGQIAQHPDQVAYYQTLYQNLSAQAQSQESNGSGTVESGQGQTSSDAQNLQMKAQLAQGVNSILTTLSGLLGRITA